MPTIRLRAFRADDEHESLRAHEELAKENFVFLLHYEPGQSWANYIKFHDQFSQGKHIPDGLVPSTFLAIDADGALVGRVSIRHKLHRQLLEDGGHIGFGIRPAYRNRGYATEALRQSLNITRTLGINAALLTCDQDNRASSQVIERCGGVLEDVRNRVRRYWIR